MEFERKYGFCALFGKYINFRKLSRKIEKSKPPPPNSKNPKFWIFDF